MVWELGLGNRHSSAGFFSSGKSFGSLVVAVGQEPSFARCVRCCSGYWRTGVFDSRFLSRSTDVCFPRYRVLPKCCWNLSSILVS